MSKLCDQDKGKQFNKQVQVNRFHFVMSVVLFILCHMHDLRGKMS